ncbi:MAG TPA: polysaccharide biosynthesis/export family protein [Gemmatimonadales bacterium]|nr:polysaccharide biosynthesis/export family protein [Gemmatimonadales bacterium]
MPRPATRLAPVLLVLGLLLPARGAAQYFEYADSAGHRMLATRAALTTLAHTLDSIAASPTITDAQRARARQLGQETHARLETGDFRAGDRVVVRVVGEVGLPETLAVSIDGDVEIATVGTVPLRGVLRSEVEEQLARAVGRVIRDPEVHAHGLVRLSVQGEVTHPGYCNVPADAPLSDVVTAAGGLTKDAKIEDLRIERGGVRLLQGTPLRRLIEEGRTLDDAGLRPGDQFVVPARVHHDPYGAFRITALLLSIPVTIYTLVKIAH